MKKIFTLLFFSVILLSGFVFSTNFTLAATSTRASALEQLNAGAKGAGLENNGVDPRIMATRIIEVFLGLIGTMAMFLFVYSGYLMITSHGDGSKVEKARKIMTGAVIGIFVILMSFSITSFVGKKLQEKINQENSIFG